MEDLPVSCFLWLVWLTQPARQRFLMSDRPKNNRPARIPASLLCACFEKWESRLQLEAFFFSFLCSSPAMLRANFTATSTTFWSVTWSTIPSCSALAAVTWLPVREIKGNQWWFYRKASWATMGILKAKLMFDNSCDILALKHPNRQKRRFFFSHLSFQDRFFNIFPV